MNAAATALLARLAAPHRIPKEQVCHAHLAISCHTICSTIHHLHQRVYCIAVQVDANQNDAQVVDIMCIVNANSHGLATAERTDQFFGQHRDVTPRATLLTHSSQHTATATV